MADDQNTQDQQNQSGAQAGDQTQQTQDGQQPGRTFTQAELDAIIADQLKREREKYKDYADLKKMADEYQKLRESQMSDQEKLQAKLAEYERQLLEREREAAEARLESLKLRVLDELGLPKTWAVRIFGTTEEEIRKDADELKKLLGTQGRTVGGGTNPAINAGHQAFTREQIEKMSPEEINGNWDAISQWMAKSK